MLKARCNCGVTYQVPDDKTGKTFKCKKCGGAVVVSAPPVAGAGTGPKLDIDVFLSNLNATDQANPLGLSREVSAPLSRNPSRKAAKNPARRHEPNQPFEVELLPPALPSDESRVTSRPARSLPSRRPVEPTRPSTLQDRILREILGRLLIHPAILCFFITASLVQMADQVVCEAPPDDIHVRLELMSQRMSRELRPQQSLAWKQSVLSTILGAVCIIGWAVRGIGPFSEYEESVKTFTVFTMVYLLVAAVFMGLWPRDPRGVDSQLLEGLWWAAAAMWLLITLWGAVLIVSEDGWGRMLALILIGPYATFYLMFGRPAGRMALIAVFGSGAVTLGISCLDVITFAKYRNMDDAIAGKLAVPPERPPIVLTPAVQEDPTQPAGEKLIEKFVRRQFNINPDDLARLGPYESEGPFEFRPPTGFKRHAIHKSKVFRWDPPGTTPGDNSILITTFKRPPGDKLANHLVTVGSTMQVKIDDMYLFLQPDYASVIDHQGLQFVRFMPSAAEYGPRGTQTQFQYLVIDSEYLVGVRCSLDSNRFFHDRGLLEASVQTLRRRK